MTGYLYRVPDGFDPNLHFVSEGVTRHKVGGRIYRQMVQVGELSSKAASALAPFRSVLGIAPVGIAMGAFLHLQVQMRKTHSMLQLVLTKLDNRHRDNVFAGLNASFDVLTLADSMSASEAKSFVLNNYAGVARDLSLLDAYLAELRAEADTIDKLVISATLEVAAASLEAKLLFVTGRGQLAADRVGPRLALLMQLLRNFFDRTYGRTLDECRDESKLKRLLAYYCSFFDSDELSMFIRVKSEAGLTGYWRDVANEEQVRSMADAYGQMYGLKVEAELASTSPELFRELCNKDSEVGQYRIYITESDADMVGKLANDCVKVA